MASDLTELIVKFFDVDPEQAKLLAIRAGARVYVWHDGEHYDGIVESAIVEHSMSMVGTHTSITKSSTIEISIVKTDESNDEE